MRRQMRQLDRNARRQPKAPRRRRPELVSIIATLLLRGAVLWLPNDVSRAARAAIGLGSDRLPAAPPVENHGGSFAFLQTQPATGEPVGYNPCRTVRYAINPEGAPANYADLIATAVERTSAATGLEFERVEDTRRRDFDMRISEGAPAPPVLVAWATAEEMPDLAGDVAGVGGSVATRALTNRLRYVTGIVVLDRETFAQSSDSEVERALAQAIVDHEFGHLVGLDHVDDPGELMYDDNLGRTTYGPGDLEGLARLGNIAC